MPSSLLVAVKQAKFDIPLPPDAKIYVSVRVNGISKRTSVVKVQNPIWNERLEYSFEYPSKNLEYELRQKGLICDSVLGSGCIPITQIFTALTEGEGNWYPCYTWTKHEWNSSGQKLLLDCRFTFSSDISAEEQLSLESKLSAYKDILQYEIQAIKKQYEKINKEGFLIDTKRLFRKRFSLQGNLKDITEEEGEDGKSAHERRHSRGMKRSVTEGLYSRSNSQTEADMNMNTEIGMNSSDSLGGITRRHEKVDPKVLWQKAIARVNSNSYLDMFSQQAEEMKEHLIEQDTVPSAENSDDSGSSEKDTTLPDNITSSNKNKITTLERKKRFSRVALKCKQTHLLFNIDASSDIKPRLTSIFDAVHSAKIRAKTLSPRLSFKDELLKDHVYKKALQALIYPMSLTKPHVFEIFSAQHPVYCEECEGLLYGLSKQGLRCSECGTKCHEKCKDLIDADCLQRAFAKSLKATKEGTEESLKIKQSYISSTIEKRLIENHSIFDMLKDTFDIDEQLHSDYLQVAKENILDGSSKWSAKIAITVVSARDLAAKDDEGTSDPYVTVQVGRTKKRTKTVHYDLNPAWNERFDFECNKTFRTIKVRVWDEDDNLTSKLRHKLTRESDEFLGQTIIDVRTLSGSMDAWYTLEKRTEKSSVSGSIRLLIRIDIEGEETTVPYNTQYSFLHESLYQQTPANRILAIPDKSDRDSWKVYFDEPGQEIVDEFAIRYGIETIFQAMTHFSCLAPQFNEDGVPLIMNTLLANISCYFSQRTSKSASSSKQHFAASKFGEERFEKILDQLFDQIRMCLSSYRSNFPSSDPKKLSDLKATVDLLTSIVFFRKKVLEYKVTQRSSDVVKQCVNNCLDSNFSFMLNNCMQSCVKDHRETEGFESHAVCQDLDYWLKLIQFVAGVIEEDKTVYSKILNHFPSDLDLDMLSATRLWHSLIMTLQEFLNKQENTTGWANTDYISLYFKMKGLFNQHVSDLSKYENAEPEYLTMFEPFIADWLDENDEKSMEYLFNAIDLDNKDDFKTLTEESRYSSSVVDTFSFLVQTIDIIQKLDIPNKELELKIVDRYSLIVEKVLMQYCKSVILIFKKICQGNTNVNHALVIINNVHHCRVQLECLYEKIGVESINEDTQKRFKELQDRLSRHVNELCEEYGGFVSENINFCCKQTNLQLPYVNNLNCGSSNYSEQLEKQALDVMHPIIEFVNGNFLIYHRNCERPVLKRLLKVLWTIILQNIRKEVILPVNYDGLGTVDGDKASSRDLNQSQCAVINAMLDILQSFFHDQGNGIKLSFFEKNLELRELQYIIGLYSKTSDTLIKEYISIVSEQQTRIQDSDNVGEVYINVDIFTYALTGERKVTVKVIEAKHLQWHLSATFLPYIQVCVLGPHLSERRWRASTRSKSNKNCPKYNETFEFRLGGDEDLSSYELQISAKDYCFGRTDRLIGTVVLPFLEITRTNSYSSWLDLGKSISINDDACKILQILTLRKNDETAKHFVMLKSEQRME